MSNDVIRIDRLPLLPVRRQDSNKGTFGKVLVVAGSRGMSGAAVLCGRSALRSGAGLVEVATPDEVQPIVATSYPGYITIPIRQTEPSGVAAGAASELLSVAASATVAAIGPGLGKGPGVRELVTELLAGLAEKPVVLDADALNCQSPWRDHNPSRSAPLILTPHPGEFARLTGQDIPRSDPDRQTRAVEFAARFSVILVLKGSGTLVTDGQRLYRNTTGNPGMATGGTGDVLTGVVAALVAQGLTGFDAAVLGVWVHGRAGDLAAADLGQTALTALDLLDYLPAVFRDLEHRNGKSP